MSLEATARPEEEETEKTSSADEGSSLRGGHLPPLRENPNKYTFKSYNSYSSYNSYNSYQSYFSYQSYNSYPSYHPYNPNHPMKESSKEVWKIIINVIVAALSAIGTALGVTSCMAVLG